MRRLVAGVWGLVTALVVSGCKGDDNAVLYIAELRGDAGPPLVITDARGDFTVIDNGNTMTWTLNGSQIESVLGAHVHAGATGQDGVVLLDLLPNGPPSASFTGGTISTRTFDQADIAGSISLDSLRALMANGNAYVDVHTGANPDGELRGQITRDN